MSFPTSFSLFKRRGIFYVLYLHDGKRKWKSTKCTRKNDALRVLTDLKSFLKPRVSTKLLSEFASEYLQFVQTSLMPGTVDICRASLKQFLSFAGDIPLTTITEKHVDGYKVVRLQHVKPVTVNIELRTLRAVFNVALRWGVIERNPFARLKLVRVPESSPVYLSREECQRLLHVVEEDWLKEMIVFAVCTGTRRGEMLNLRWKDVDFTRRLIHIQNSEAFRAKHGKSRVIPMNDVVCSLLSTKMANSRSEYVFTRKRRMIGKSYLSHLFKRYVRKAGIDDRMHWHSLRHTHASWLVQNGVSLYEVQKLLGHSSILVTQIYGHLHPERLHETVNKITINMN